MVSTGSGTARIQCQSGTTDVIIDQGRNRIEITGGDVTLCIKRTGLPQTIIGFTQGNIDLSDWAALGPVTISAQANGDTAVSAGTERGCFVNTAPKTVLAALPSQPKLHIEVSS